jgi:arylsulfatase A
MNSRLVCVALLLLGGLLSAAEKPNLLLLFIDNVGYGDLGCYGNQAVQTPNLDQLARDGVRCTDFYIGSPSCSPSRGAILTGRHPQRNGLNYQLSTSENMGGEGLPLTEKLMPQYLKPLGYATGAFGKWNIGFGPGYRPTDRGFDEFLGHMSGNIHYYKYLYHGQNDLRQGTEPVDRRGIYATDLFADAAIDFIKRHASQPWLVYLPFNAAHFVSAANTEKDETVQWQVPAQYLARYGCPPDEPDQAKRFRAVLTALDDAIGRVLQTVDDLKQRERTLVFCISDNGAFMLPGRGLEVQSNQPLREGGVTTYEGGVRVPAIVRWPGRLPAGALCREMLSSHDVLPSMLAAAGGAPPADRTLDGNDILKTLAGQAPSPHKTLHWVWDQGKKEQWRGARAGDWKIVRKSDTSPWELYDLSRDLGEATDLAAQQPQRLKTMVDEFARWQAAISADPTRGLSPRARK